MSGESSREERAPIASDGRGSERGALWAVVAVVAVAFAAPAFILGSEAVAATFWDDSFYYFEIARNVASGRGFTFDGLHDTNGFQPLWLLLLVPVFAFVPGEFAPLRVVALLEASFLALAGILVVRTLRERLGGTAALLAALLLVALPGSPRSLRGGMEGALVLCLLAAVWRGWLALARAPEAPLGRWLGLGLLCSAAFLARFEAIVLLPAILLLGRRRFVSDLRAAAALVAPVLVGGAAYLAWNRIAFGTWLPISGLVRAHWAGQAFREADPFENVLVALRVPWIGEKLVRRLSGSASEAFYDFPPVGLAAYLTLLALVAACAWRYRASLRRAVADSGTGLVLLGAALMVLVDKLAVRDLNDWQEVPILFATAILGAALLGRAPRLARAAVAIALAAGLARGPLTAWYWRHPSRSLPYHGLQAASWLNRHTGESERIGSWNSGAIGYFSNRAVVSLDGLVNDAAFFRTVVQPRRLGHYLRSERIAWIADYACGSAPGLSYFVRNPNPMFQQRIYLTGDEGVDSEYELASSFSDPEGRNGCGYVVWRARWRPGSEGRP